MPLVENGMSWMMLHKYYNFRHPIYLNTVKPVRVSALYVRNLQNNYLIIFSDDTERRLILTSQLKPNQSINNLLKSLMILILIHIDLRRFDYIGNKCRKLSTHVDSPLQDLDLSSYAANHQSS